MRKVIVFITVLTLCVYGGFLSTNTGFGKFVPVVDAVSNSMGGSQVFSWVNPASFTGSTFFSISGGIYLPVESRSIRVFDTYDNTVGKVVVSSNASLLSGSYGAVARMEKSNFLVGFSCHPYILSSYRYYNERRDEFYNLMEVEEEEDEVNILAYSPFAGFKLKYFSIGAGMKVLRGYSHFYTRLDSVSAEQWDRWKGTVFTAGLKFTLNAKFSVGVLYNTGFELFGSDTLFYPPYFSTGIRYAPANLLPSVVIGEISFVPWSGALRNGVNCGFEDVLIYRFGVQHRLTSSLFMRLGFTYSNSPLNSSITKGTYTAGLGWSQGKNQVDISFNFSSTGYKGADAGFTGELENLYFSETETEILLTIRREL